MWTVEWFDDEKRQLTETSSTCQIALAQPFTPREQHKVRKRKRDVERSLATDSSITQDATPTSENQNKPIELGVELEVVDQEREHSPSRTRALHSNEEKVEEFQTHLAEAHHADHRDDGSVTKPMGDGKHRFFLLKPRTTSSRHVLIPLDSNATLGECLNGRTVLEFPTIYVFPDTVQQLPEDFMLEEEYLKQEGEEQKEFNDLISELDPEILERLKEDGQRFKPGTGREEVDSKEILDMLKKDFGAVV